MQRRCRPESRRPFSPPAPCLMGTVAQSSTKEREAPNCHLGGGGGDRQALGDASQQGFHQKSWSPFRDDGRSSSGLSPIAVFTSTNKLLPQPSGVKGS